MNMLLLSTLVALVVATALLIVILAVGPWLSGERLPRIDRVAHRAARRANVYDNGMRTPADGKPRETVRSTRLGPEDDANFERRRLELGLSVSTYLRKLVRDDAAAHPERQRGK